MLLAVPYLQVRFVPPTVSCVDGTKRLVQSPIVLTASMDKSMALWSPESPSGMWLPVSRMGDMSGNSHGFLGGLISPSHRLVVAHGYQVCAVYQCICVCLVLHITCMFVCICVCMLNESMFVCMQGAFHVWRRSTSEDADWQLGVQISGHFGPVYDVLWGLTGQYLASCSDDFTVRVWTPLRPSGSGYASVWGGYLKSRFA